MLTDGSPPRICPAPSPRGRARSGIIFAPPPPCVWGCASRGKGSCLPVASPVSPAPAALGTCCCLCSVTPWPWPASCVCLSVRGSVPGQRGGCSVSPGTWPNCPPQTPAVDGEGLPPHTLGRAAVLIWEWGRRPSGVISVAIPSVGACTREPWPVLSLEAAGVSVWAGAGGHAAVSLRLCARSPVGPGRLSGGCSPFPPPGSLHGAAVRPLCGPAPLGGLTSPLG